MTALSEAASRGVPVDLTPRILRGHVLDVLKTMPEGSVQCVVTSPPYWGLRAYGTEPQVWGGSPAHSHEWVPTSPRRQREPDDAGGTLQQAHEGASYAAQGGEACACGAWRGELGLEPTPDLFVSHLADVFDAVRRVLREDGTCWVNLGDTYATHPAGLTGEKRWATSGLGNGDKTGLEQAGAFDKRAPGLKPKDLVGIPWRFAFEAQRRGWWLRSDCVWAKPNPMPESVTDRPTRSHEYVFLLTKSERYFYDADAVRQSFAPEVAASMRGKSVGEDGLVVISAPSTKGRTRTGSRMARPMNEGSSLESGKRSKVGGMGLLPRALNPAGANLKSVWWIATQPYPDAHFATFPEALPELCIKAGTSERGACAECGAGWERNAKRPQEPDGLRHDGLKYEFQRTRGGINGSLGAWWSTHPRETTGWLPTCSHPPAEPVPCLVLDPFAGSGTVLQVARSLGRRSLGIELKPEYAAQARKRARADLPDLERFADEEARA